jgi:hypothetical protein
LLQLIDHVGLALAEELVMTPPPQSAGRARILLLLAVAAFIIPVAIDFFICGSARAFGYLAIDFFYYETIAKNHLTFGFATFDQENPTNGFHPLWQGLLILTLRMTSALALQTTNVFLAILAISAALICLAIYFAWLAFRVGDGRISPFFPWVIPGAFALLTAVTYRPEHDFERLRITGGERAVVGTLWHYLNGMETPLVLVAFCGSLVLLTKISRIEGTASARGRFALAGGGALGILALARLDHAIFSVTMVWTMLLCEHRPRERRRLFLLTCIGVAVPLSFYLISNYATTGALIPVSGSVKSSFPRITNDNMTDLIEILRGRRRFWVADAWRLCQQLVPPVLALAFATSAIHGQELLRGRLSFRHHTTPLDVTLFTTIPAVFALGSYNFLFVRSDFQGHWYFPVSVLLCSVYILRILPRVRLGSWIEASSLRFASWNVFSAGAILTFFFSAHFRPRMNEDIASFYQDEAPLILRAYATHSQPPKFLEFYDAIFASSTGFPTMNGYGLVVDPEAAAARKKGLDNIFELAIERGFTRVVSFNLSGRHVGTEPSRAGLVKTLQRYVTPETLALYDLELDYISEDRRHVIIRVTGLASASP